MSVAKNLSKKYGDPNRLHPPRPEEEHNILKRLKSGVLSMLLGWDKPKTLIHCTLSAQKGQMFIGIGYESRELAPSIEADRLKDL